MYPSGYVPALNQQDSEETSNLRLERRQESGERDEEVRDRKGDGASFEAVEYAESTGEQRK